MHSCCSQTASSHVIAHVAGVCGLRNVLLLEAFARYLLGVALVVRAPAHPLLEAFAAACRPSGSVLLDACCAGCSWSYREARARLASVATLHVVRTLSHPDPWTWLELLDWLPVSDAASSLVLVLRLLIGAVGRLLLLIHVSAGMKCSC